jgi:hypothetical protein
MWKAALGSTYQVQCSTNLSANEWFDYGDSIEGDGTLHSFLESTRHDDSKYFRVIVLP